MKKVLSAALVTALGLVAVSPAFATQSRINSLSAGGATFGDLTATPVFNEKFVTIRDSGNILFLPQYLPTYKNTVDVDASVGATYGTMNVRYALSEDAVLTLFGKKSAWLPVTKMTSINGGAVPPVGPGDPATAAGYPASARTSGDPTNHQFGVGFGMKAGETMRLGAMLSIGGVRNDGDINKNDSNTLVDFNGGVGFDVGLHSLDFALNVKFGSFVNREANQDRYVPDGLFGIGLLAKGEFQVADTAKIVPYFRFGYDGRGVVHIARTDEQGSGNEQKRGHLRATQINLGSDLQIHPQRNQDVLIQPSIGIAIRTSGLDGNDQPGPQGSNIVERNMESSSQYMPFYGFAAEAKAFDWMVLRLGARQTVQVTNNDNTAPAPAPSTETHVSTVINTITTGVGIKLSEWRLDLNVNPTFYNNGVYAVTGNTTAPFAVDFALGYEWL